jgi:hypothetical protein
MNSKILEIKAFRRKDFLRLIKGEKMKRLFLITIALLASASFAAAQTTTGRLSGVVSSPDGALPGATVTATDNNTGKTQTVTSGSDGAFLFPQLEFGTYTVTITASGFKTFSATEVKIDVGREYTLNPALEVGNVQETVTIQAGADIVTATSAQISNTVSPQQILSLPLLARNPIDLIGLQAGTQSSSAQNTTINGMRTSFTNITRDGINIQDPYIRTNATDFSPGRPTVDDTAEFTISTSNQEADQGYGGAQVRLVTPRGGKDFSGALYAYNRNSAFAANNFFNNRSALERPFRNRNQFGGKLSGPLPLPRFGEGTPLFYKDKGFFFTNYEKVIDPVSSRYTRTILTPGARVGEFRYNRANTGNAIDTTVGTARVVCPAKPTAQTVSVCTVSDILGFARGLGFADVPTTINPVIQSRILSQLPTQSNFTGGDQLNTAGFTLNRLANTERTSSTSRIDIDFNDRNSINGVFSYNLETNLRPDSDVNTYSTRPEVDQTSENRFLALAYRRVFSSNIVNEVRGGLFFSDVLFNRNSALPDYFLTVPLITNPETTYTNQGRYVKSYNLQDNVDWIVGNHNLKFGGQMQYFQPTSFVNFGTTPTFFVQTVAGFTPNFTTTDFANYGGIASAATANGLLGLLGGFVVQGQKTFYVADPKTGFDPNIGSVQPFRYSNHSLYVSDRWQVNPNFTLTGGVRYEIFPALELDNGLALEPVVPEGADPIQTILSRNGTYDLIGGNSGVKNTYYKTDYNNFAPQIGFAWSPKFENRLGKFLLGESFVVRGGYSQAYSNDQIVTATDSAAGANVGLSSLDGFARNSPTDPTIFNLRLGRDNLPPFLTPGFTAPPRTFLQNNALANNFGTVFLIDPNLQTSKVEQYSLGIQRELPGDMAIEVRYVGTRSNNLIRAYDLNQVDIFNNGFLADFERARSNQNKTGNAFCNPQTVAGCQALQIFTNQASQVGPGRLLIGGPVATGLPLATFTTNLTNGTPADLAFAFSSSQQNYNNHPTVANPNAVPRVNFVANPATGVVDFFTNSGYYNYNSLQVELRRRFSQGLYFQANYTFSKNLTNAIGSANSPSGGQSQFEPFLDINRRELDEQRADIDQRHVFNFNGIYQLPFGRGKAFLNQGGIVDKIFGGWEVSGIVNWTSGIPITFIDNRGTYNRTARSVRQTASSSLNGEQIQDLIGIFEANGKIYFINPSVIAPAGTSGAGSATAGFGQTPFEGQVFFNNEPGQTGNIGRTIVNGPTYFNVNAGLLKNIRFGESMRLQLRAEAFNVLNNVNLTLGNAAQYQNINSATFGQITTASSPRIMQFAVRFEF